MIILKRRLENIFEQADDLRQITKNLRNHEDENLEMIDEAILWLGIVEIRADELTYPIVMDEWHTISEKIF